MSAGTLLPQNAHFAPAAPFAHLLDTPIGPKRALRTSSSARTRLGGSQVFSKARFRRFIRRKRFYKAKRIPLRIACADAPAEEHYSSLVSWGASSTQAAAVDDIGCYP